MLALLLSPSATLFAATDTGDADPTAPPRKAQPPATSAATAKPELAETPSPGNEETPVAPTASKRAPASTGLCDGS